MKMDGMTTRLREDIVETFLILLANVNRWVH